MIDYKEKHEQRKRWRGRTSAKRWTKKTKKCWRGQAERKNTLEKKNTKKAGWGAGIAQNNKNKCETNRIIELSLERNALFC